MAGKATIEHTRITTAMIDRNLNRNLIGQVYPHAQRPYPAVGGYGFRIKGRKQYLQCQLKL
jgi:hypothetical protein